MKKFLWSFVLLLVLFSCKSVKKHNEQITKLHPSEDLHSDIDKLYQQLKRHHPKLYQYTPKAKLDFKFDSLKIAINKPLDSRTFYKKVAPVVAQIKQGHIGVSSVGKWFARKENNLKIRSLSFMI